ncbi:serine hydrolase [Actinomadura namibiensis]|uniref:serine hydrolase n=1 Tax=Actinomadura kijaniata TaxID=46161 RepID=UPI00362346DD
MRRFLAAALATVLATGCAAHQQTVHAADTTAPAAPAGATEDFGTAEDVLRHLTAHPGDAALVTYRPGRPPEVAHRGGAPAPVASAIKIVHLAAYATAVARGRLDPAERVSLRAWEAYHIPGTDGGAHPRAVKELGIGRTATLDQLVTAMIEYSDNAATDYLRHRLGERALLRAAALGGLPLAAIPSLGGQMLLAFGPCGNGEFDSLDGIRRLAALPARERRARAERCMRDYTVHRRPPATLPGIDVQAAWTETTEPIAPATLAGLMGRVATGRLVSAKASAVARRHLEWPTRRGPLNDRIVRMGAKGGSLPGVLAEAVYTVAADGTVRVTVLSMRRMPPALWFEALRSYAHQQFVIKLSDTPGYPERVRTALTRRKAPS